MSTTLGNNIKNVREKNKETQKDLANYLFISFQSVSKWENGETTPDIYTLVKIAQHYNVSLNYLLGFDAENYNKKIVLDYVIDDFPLTYNAKSNFSVWTDFEINNSIAPNAKTTDNRHRCEASEIYRASDNLEDIVIAFNEQGKIIYMAERTGFGYGSPSDIFYHNKIERIKELDCFNILDSYIPFVRDMYPHHYHDYEFIIPKNGFVITGNLKSESFVSFMKFILGDVCDVHSELFSITNNMRICKDYFQEGQLDFIKCSCLENKTNILASKNMNIIHKPNVMSLEEKVDELNKRLINIEKILKKLENN